METLGINIPKHRVKWQVSLSNGETHYEDKGLFVEIAGELSAWQKLIRYTIDNRLLITSLSLFTDKGQRFNLPSAGKNPKFRPFDIAEKPIDYIVQRYIDAEIDPADSSVKGGSNWYTVAVAIYATYKLQIWVDENNPDSCWVLKT